MTSKNPNGLCIYKSGGKFWWRVFSSGKIVDAVTYGYVRYRDCRHNLDTQNYESPVHWQRGAVRAVKRKGVWEFK